jgi:hypothetical protein
MAGFIGSQARVHPARFYFSTTRNPDQADQPCILHIPGINGSIRTEKAALPSPSAYCIYLPSPAHYYYPTTAKDLKRFSAKFRPGQDSNQERARRLTPTRAMPLLKFDSDRFDVHLPSLICDPTIVKDPKGTPTTVCL